MIPVWPGFSCSPLHFNPSPNSTLKVITTNQTRFQKNKSTRQCPWTLDCDFPRPTKPVCSLLVIPQDTHHMQVRCLSTTAVDTLFLLLHHVALLDLFHLARGREVCFLQLCPQLGLGCRQLALAPEIHKVAVHVHVECSGVGIHDLGSVVLLLSEKQNFVLCG